MMRVILEPLIGDVPIVGAVTMFFIQRPVRPSPLTSIGPLSAMTILRLSAVPCAPHVIDFMSILTDQSTCLMAWQKLDINWTGLTNLLDIPGLK